MIVSLPQLYPGNMTIYLNTYDIATSIPIVGGVIIDYTSTAIVTGDQKVNSWLLWADQTESLGPHWVTRTTQLFQIMLSIVIYVCNSWSTLIYTLFNIEETVVLTLMPVCCLSTAAEQTENFHLLQSIPLSRVDDLSWPPSCSNQHCCMFITAGKYSAAVHHQSDESVFVRTVYSVLVWVIVTVSPSCTNYFNIILMIISLVLGYKMLNAEKKMLLFTTLHFKCWILSD